MPSFESRSAWGSGGRTLGPTTAVRDVSLPLERLGLGGERRGTSEDSSRRSAPAASAAPKPATAAPEPAPAPAVPGGPDYKDAFRVGRSASAHESKSSWKSAAEDKSAPASKFRSAVEAERWRSRLNTETKKDRDDRLDSYRQPTQADWARERLHGAERKSDEAREEEAHDVRRMRVVAQSWRSNDAHLVEVIAIDRLEDTLRRRLGELDASGRTARQFFADCDPQRQGRVLLGPFVEAIGRKLNYDFPARGGQPGARDVLTALFRRYDLQREGVLHADDFHAALVGAARPGRASGRVVNALGRLREGLVRHAGGYDALLMADGRWLRSSQSRDLPEGMLTAGAFIDELMELCMRSETRLSEADLVTVLETFEPPAEALRDASAAARAAVERADEPLVSFDEFTLAVRGPSMGSARVQVTRAAYAALKDDAKSGIKSAVKPMHLAERYDVARHPAVASRTMDEEAAAMAFLHVWFRKEALDCEVELKEFCDRYEWIAPLYDDDRDYENMMMSAWRLK